MGLSWTLEKLKPGGLEKVSKTGPGPRPDGGSRRNRPRSPTDSDHFSYLEHTVMTPLLRVVRHMASNQPREKPQNMGLS